ncbi:MAG: D-tyrosyl-tRNA(Tyr) deacylase [Eubacteriaceae bacterium]|jgi:D-tyrosyl-tRNA(Tyr) deacylase|nr:D-tyrosyl-tRNA(Tyr) deacylase [Eubacteriaceae bacterium]
MVTVIQRVSDSRVEINGNIQGEIAQGLTILLGVKTGDTLEDATFLAKKIANMRIFEDEEGKMNLSIKDVGGSALVISQFTLLADCKKGNRPSFIQAAEPQMAKRLYEEFIVLMRKENIVVEEGIFAADMKVHIANDGPVTIVLDSAEFIKK